ncbi:hypothetical protein niasHT_021120 [Heterodera trifolii]|uniref:RING-type E3 ubiquitin transferase n=1 Tax=Heterodera trifolii TaxID=157864 RepID=A0ABD2JF01_9BILA
MNNGLPGPNTTDTITGGKTLELSKYDKVRRPHKMIGDDTKIKVTVRTLSTELCCPICLDLLTCTMTTKECLHRFCSECITTALMRGNKECPTCRKKIVSKRSLRPDPNFDFLISKIWPDRKLYETELNASMQFFQEQSNVAALQKSIEEGIKAQAAYRKQRVQGSYDYEKKKRRPPKMAVDSNASTANPPASSSTENGGEGHSSPAGTENASGELVDQVVVTLTPAPVEAMEVDSSSTVAAHNQQIPTANSAFSSSEDLDSSSDISSDDSSDLLSSDSTLSADLSSDELSNPSTVRSVMDETHCQQQPTDQTSRSRCASSEEGADLLILETMAEEMCRKGDEIEVELAPSKSLLSSGSVPAHMHCSHFVRAPSEITMEHLGEFLLQRSHQSSTDSNKGRATNDQQLQSQPPQPLKSAPKNFHILDRHYQLRKLSPRDTLCMAFLLSINWDRHLTLFFDLNGETQQRGGTDMAETIGEELAKMVEGQRKVDKEEEERESHRKERAKRPEDTSGGNSVNCKMEVTDE